MKGRFASLLISSLLLVSCSTTQPPTTLPITPTPATSTPTPPSAPDPLNTPWDDRSIFKSGLVESQHHILDELEGASVYHIELNIADNLFNVSGSETVQYTNTEDVPLNEIQFRLFPNILGGKMDISNLQVNDQPANPKYELANSLLIVPLSNELNPGESIIIHMDFTVEVPQILELNHGTLAYVDDVLALAHAYPMIAVYDDEGWNAEIPPQSGDVTYSDASFYIVRISAPKELTLATSGSEISHIDDGQAQVMDVASGPARDFYLAASPKFESKTKQVGEITVRSFAFKEADRGSAYTLDVAQKAIETFSKRYAPYPYTEFDIIETPTLALGIEYPGAIVIASRIYDTSGQFNDTPTTVYLEATVAHEVGHQWFYNLVGNDQLDDPWLDESLTQFATLQYYADRYGISGTTGFRASLKGRWQRVENKKIPIGLPVASYSGIEYGAIVYGRGPLFFEALKNEMGAEAFDAFLNEYTNKYSWETSTPEGLQSLAEENCNCNLDSIFKEWIY